MKSISRRQFVKYSSLFGGYSSLLSMNNLMAAEASARKLVIVSVGHSLDPFSQRDSRQWVPSTSTANGIGNLEAFLSPLAPFKDKMAAVAGCNNVVAKMVKSNGHNASSRTLLTCLPHAEFSGVGSTLGTASLGGGPSIEYVLSQRLGAPPLILRSGKINNEHRRTFLPDGSNDHGENNPVRAFENLFSTVLTTSKPELPVSLKGESALARLKAKRGEVLESVRSNYEAVASRAGVEDRIRLQSHAALVDNLIKDIQYTSVSSCEKPSIFVPEDFVSTFDKTSSGRDDDMISRMHNSVVATALGCGSTRVASLHYSNMQRNEFPFLNGGENLFDEYGVTWHQCCHHDNGTPDELRVFGQTWYSTMLADLLTKLSGASDGAGSVLDNTIVVFTSSLGSSGHSTNNIPFLVFGGKNSGLKTNQVLDYDGSRSVADMWVTILRLMGQSDEVFGQKGSLDGVPYNNGPLLELMG